MSVLGRRQRDLSELDPNAMAFFQQAMQRFQPPMPAPMGAPVAPQPPGKLNWDQMPPIPGGDYTFQAGQPGLQQMTPGGPAAPLTTGMGPSLGGPPLRPPAAAPMPDFGAMGAAAMQQIPGPTSPLGGGSPFQMPQLTAPPALTPLPPAQGLPPAMPGQDRLANIMGAGEAAAAEQQHRLNPMGGYLGDAQSKAMGAQAYGDIMKTYAQIAAAQGDDPAKIAAVTRGQDIGAMGDERKLALGQQTNEQQLGSARMQAEATLGGHKLSAEGQLAAAQEAARGHVKGAEIEAAARNHPHVLFTQALANLAPGLLNGTVDITGITNMMQALGAAQGMIPGQSGSPGVPAAPGAAPAATDPAAKLKEIATASQLGQNAGAAFLGPDQKPLPELNIDHGEKFLDALATQRANVDSPEFKELAAKIKAGRMGDPQKVIGAIVQAGSRANYQVQPPQKNKDGGYPDYYHVLGTDQQPLYSYRSDPKSAFRMLGNLLGGAGTTPYNKVIRADGGGEYDVNPTDLRRGYKQTYGTMPSAETATNRAAYTSALLEALKKSR